MKKQISTVVVALALVAAACGGSDSEESAPSRTDAPESTTTAAPTDTEAVVTTTAAPADDEHRVFVSDDGNLMVALPPGDDTEVTIDVLDPAEWPEPLDQVTTTDGVTIYELGPDGAAFAEPVRVYRRFDVGSFADLELGLTDVPVITALTTDADGNYELLGDQAVLRFGSDVWVSGTTTHFTPVIFSNDQTTITIEATPAPTFTFADTASAEDLAAVEGLGIDLSGVDGLPDASPLPSGEALGEVPVQVLPSGSDVPDAGIDLLTSGGTFTFADTDLNGSFAVLSTEQELDLDDLPSTGTLLNFGGATAPPGSVDFTGGVGIILTNDPSSDPVIVPNPITGRLELVTTHTELRGFPTHVTAGMAAEIYNGSLDGYLLVGDATTSIDGAYLPSNSVVDAAPVGPSDDGHTAAVGVLCYCDYALFALLLPQGSPAPTGATLGEAVGPDGQLFVFSDPDSGMALTFPVTAAEGVTFDADVDFLEAFDMSAFDTP